MLERKWEKKGGKAHLCDKVWELMEMKAAGVSSEELTAAGFKSQDIKGAEERIQKGEVVPGEGYERFYDCCRMC